MKIKNTQWAKWVVLALTMMVVTACGETHTTSSNASSEATSQSSAASQAKQVAIAITLKEDGKTLNPDNAQFEVTEGEKLMDVLKAHFDVKEKDGFITSIDGHAQDESAKKYWTYTVNGQMADVGANDYALQNGDTVIFTLGKIE